MSNAVYALSRGVQVRREKFGLLFYDYRGPRLYFVPSRDLIEADFFRGRQTVDALVADIGADHPWPEKWIRNRVQQVVTLLESKGLIHGKSIC